MASEQVKKLAERINREFGLTVDAERFYRTYATKSLKAAGAFIWVIYGKNFVIGGCETLKKYVTKKNRLAISKDRFNEFELYAYSPDEIGYDKLKGVERG